MATIAFPSRCSVAVVSGEHLVSQVYPASVPVEVFIDNVVDLIDEDLRRRGASGLDGAVTYELQRANGSRLDVTKSLDELGVEDGTTLVLAQAVDDDPFEPQYESLSTGLARIGRTLFAPVTEETAVRTAIGLLSMATLVILGLSIYTRARTPSWAPAVVCCTVGALFAAGAWSVSRWFPGHRDLLDGLGWLAIPALAVGSGVAAPGGLGAAQLFIAALAAAVFSGAMAAMTQRHIAAAALLVTLGAVGAAAAAARIWRPLPAQWLGMCTLIGLLVLLTLAPTLALSAARIRPPHFGSITGKDLFRRNDGMPVDAVAPVDEGDEPGRETTPGGTAILTAAKRANDVLTGICVAAAVALPAAVWATLQPGTRGAGGALVLATLFVIIVISRARAFTDRRQAVALVCGAAAAVCAAVVRYAVHAHGQSAAVLLWGAVVLLAFASAGLAAALLVPVTRFTPLVRMVAEWLELVAIVVALPLAAWIGGLFTWVRMR